MLAAFVVGRRRALAVLAAAAVAPLCACGPLAPTPPRAPTLKFSNLRTAGIGPEGLRLEVVVDCANPNDFDVPLSALSFDLDLLGAPFASGSALDEPLTIPAGASRPVTLNVTVPMGRMRDLLRRLRPSELSAVDYRIRGSVRWGTLGIPVPFDRSGKFAPFGAARAPASREPAIPDPANREPAS